MNRTLLACILASFFLIGCAEKAPIGAPLGTSGSVRLWMARPTTKLSAIAAQQAGLELSESAKDKPWFHLLNAEQKQVDLVFTELGREFAQGRSAGTFAELSALSSRMSSIGKLWPALKPNAKDKSLYFLPSSIYIWGLFYNKELLDSLGMKYPESLHAFESVCAALSAKGIAPIALGAKGDWSVCAWLSYLDIRLNGLNAHRSLLDGKRAFDDSNLDKVYARLQAWRDKGWIDKDAGSKDWSEALQSVETGKAAFSLMGAFAANRFTKPEKIRWARVPLGNGGKGSGSEVAVIQGFAVSAKAPSVEAAVALADAYISASSPDVTSDDFSLSSLVAEYAADAGKGDVRSSIKAEQVKAIGKTSALVPQMDRYLPAQAAYDVIGVLTKFFEKDSTMNASALKAALAAIKR